MNSRWWAGWFGPIKFLFFSFRLLKIVDYLFRYIIELQFNKKVYKIMGKVFNSTVFK
jgi:hypothetical protein